LNVGRTFVLKIQIFFLTTMMIVMAYANSSAVSGSTENIYCYDQNMETHFCFESREECEIKQKHDLEANTLCYEQAE
jgi:hypothetical protein